MVTLEELLAKNPEAQALAEAKRDLDAELSKRGTIHFDSDLVDAYHHDIRDLEIAVKYWADGVKFAYQEMLEASYRQIPDAKDCLVWVFRNCPIEKVHGTDMGILAENLHRWLLERKEEKNGERS